MPNNCQSRVRHGQDHNQRLCYEPARVRNTYHLERRSNDAFERLNRSVAVGFDEVHEINKAAVGDFLTMMFLLGSERITIGGDAAKQLNLRRSLCDLDS